ncbi:MAG: hypothetical protein L6R28_15030 [Planctomycetes bacterium]|nr:hypothetical protein [Planctomycetota bacterium]
MTLLLVAASACAEELDLTRIETIDWAAEDQGGETGAHLLLSPTDDPAELAELMRKLYGVRLSSEDPQHAVVIALGRQPEGVKLELTRTTMDRFGKLVELEALITMPERAPNAAGAANGEKKADEELVIVPTPPEGAKEAKAPEVRARRNGGNPAIFLPTGKLEPGTWYLRVKYTRTQDGKSEELPAQTVSFSVKDNRPYQKGEKGRNTPNIGLEPPKSKSVTEGMGGP